MTLPSSNSQALSAIFAGHRDTWLSECLSLFGEHKRPLIETVIKEREQAVLDRAGSPAHTRYVNAFNELAGFLDYKMKAIRELRDKGVSLNTIADTYGWTTHRVNQFILGDRSAYFP